MAFLLDLEPKIAARSCEDGRLLHLSNLKNDEIPESKETLRHHLAQTLILHIRKGRPRESANCPESHWCLLAAGD